MPLLGSAAMLLSFDVSADAVAEHDDWHTHEHFPERLSIPGFLRGTRWIATGAGPRYMVLYEVRDLATLTSEAYLQRLNNPTPWTSKMMPHYRGMNRGLCSVAGSFGLGSGGFGALVRFRAARRETLHEWLREEVLPALPSRPGLGSAHLLEGAAAAAMTSEQRLRGADAAIASAILVTGYDAAAVEAVGRTALDASVLRERGAEDLTFATYRMDYCLAAAEIGA
jgi:hypothetical protein